MTCPTLLSGQLVLIVPPPTDGHKSWKRVFTLGPFGRAARRSCYAVTQFPTHLRTRQQTGCATTSQAGARFFHLRGVRGVCISYANHCSRSSQVIILRGLLKSYRRCGRPSLLGMANMARFSAKNWKNCATCRFWSGPRDLDTVMLATQVEPLAQGECSTRGRGIKAYATGSCNAWRLWPELRPETALNAAGNV